MNSHSTSPKRKERIESIIDQLDRNYTHEHTVQHTDSEQINEIEEIKEYFFNENYVELDTRVNELIEENACKEESTETIKVILNELKYNLRNYSTIDTTLRTMTEIYNQRNETIYHEEDLVSEMIEEVTNTFANGDYDEGKNILKELKSYYTKHNPEDTQIRDMISQLHDAFKSEAAYETGANRISLNSRRE